MATVRLRDAYDDVKRLAACGAKPKQIAYLTGVGIDAIYDHWHEFTDQPAARGPTRSGPIILEREPLHAGAFLMIVAGLGRADPAMSAVDQAVAGFSAYNDTVGAHRRHQGKSTLTMPECIELVLAHRSGAIFATECTCYDLPAFVIQDLLDRRRRCLFARDIPPRCPPCATAGRQSKRAKASV